MQEGGEIPGRVFQDLFHVTLGTLLCPVFFVSIDCMLLEVKN